jgi:predicted enzyme related to lactoylglutathione lyase
VGGVKLTVQNLAASAAFYERLGLAHTRKSNRFVQFGALSLVDAQTAVELSGGIVALEPANRRNRVELHVNDIHTAHARVTALGGHVHPIVALPWGENSFHCIDPDGNIVEVIEKRLSKEKAWGR